MNNLEKHTLRLIGEDISSPDVFADTDAGIAQIRDSINDAVQELCMVTGAYHKAYLLPLYADRQIYRMGWEADHFGWVTEAWDRDRKQRLSQTNVLSLTEYDPWWMQRTGNPEQYFQIGDDLIGVYFKPSANGIVLELDCACIPKPYTSDTDPVKLRETFERAAVYMAVSEFYASRGDARRATEKLEGYLETGDIMAIYPDAQEKIYQFGEGRRV